MSFTNGKDLYKNSYMEGYVRRNAALCKHNLVNFIHGSAQVDILNNDRTNAV